MQIVAVARQLPLLRVTSAYVHGTWESASPMSSRGRRPLIADKEGVLQVSMHAQQQYTLRIDVRRICAVSYTFCILMYTKCIDDIQGESVCTRVHEGEGGDMGGVIMCPRRCGQ